MNIVVVAPHPDDAELGMGGTIARLVHEGHDVLVVDLTNGEPTPCGSPERRMQEAAAADAVLGCKRINLRQHFCRHTKGEPISRLFAFCFFHGGTIVRQNPPLSNFSC